MKWMQSQLWNRQPSWLGNLLIYTWFSSWTRCEPLFLISRQSVDAFGHSYWSTNIYGIDEIPIHQDKTALAIIDQWSLKSVLNYLVKALIWSAYILQDGVGSHRSAYPPSAQYSWEQWTLSKLSIVSCCSPKVITVDNVFFQKRIRQYFKKYFSINFWDYWDWAGHMCLSSSFQRQAWKWYICLKYSFVTKNHPDL